MVRQGDVLLIPTTRRISERAKLIPRDRGRVVLAYGEVTGHAHALAGPLTELFEEEDGRLYLRLGADDELRHVTDLATFQRTTDHDPVALQAGVYLVVDAANIRRASQREYTPQEIRRVSD